MSERIDVLVPDFGHGLTEALVIEWHVSVGDRVERGDVVAVLETDKSSVDITAESDGVVAEIVVPARSITTSGAVLYTLTEPDERPSMTAPTDNEIDSRIVTFLRKRMPEVTTADLGRTIYYDLDVDSLDVVDLTTALEEEYGMKADLDRVSECQTFIDYRAYIRELLDAR